MNQNSCSVTSIRYNYRDQRDYTISQINTFNSALGSLAGRAVKEGIQQFYLDYITHEEGTPQFREEQKIRKSVQVLIFYILNQAALPYQRFKWTTTREIGSSSIDFSGDKSILTEENFRIPDTKLKNLKQKISVVYRGDLKRVTYYDRSDLELKPKDNPEIVLIRLFWNSHFTQFCVDTNTDKSNGYAITYTKLDENKEPLNPLDQIPSEATFSPTSSPSPDQEKPLPAKVAIATPNKPAAPIPHPTNEQDKTLQVSPQASLPEIPSPDSSIIKPAPVNPSKPAVPISQFTPEPAKTSQVSPQESLPENGQRILNSNSEASPISKHQTRGDSPINKVDPATGNALEKAFGYTKKPISNANRRSRRTKTPGPVLTKPTQPASISPPEQSLPKKMPGGVAVLPPIPVGGPNLRRNKSSSQQPTDEQQEAAISTSTPTAPSSTGIEKEERKSNIVDSEKPTNGKQRSKTMPRAKQNPQSSHSQPNQSRYMNPTQSSQAGKAKPSNTFATSMRKKDSH